MKVVLLIVGFLFSYPAQAGALKTKDTFPSMKLPVISSRQPNSKGADLSISSFKGNVVLIDFWASWCEPCKVALPAYNKLYEKYSKKGLAVWGVNVDDDKAEGQSFMKEHPMKFPVSYDAGKKLIKKVGVKT
ncbi:MAG: TlpA family protein disulfide reductase, partial [Bdellovibrionales bacterium]|nr:TlpA family protein disulfide reductase [Bdellovibrionales bacterium]